MKKYLMILIIAVTVMTPVILNGENAQAVSDRSAVVIIDPGHGGADGGAVSESGTLESEINLDIAIKLDNLFAFLGTPAILTRESETINYSSNADTIRAKKIEDQKNRVKLINSLENGFLISIHQNKYTSAGPFGAQVFYARTEGSFEAAETIQTLLISALNPQNRRTAVSAPSSIYLMNNITCPGVLIECGFLSNPKEEALLKTDGYRLKIAAVIAAGFLQ